MTQPNYEIRPIRWGAKNYKQALKASTILSLLFIIFTMGIVPIAKGQSSSPPQFSQELIDKAYNMAIFGYKDDAGKEYQNVEMRQTKTIFFMALLVHSNPNATTSTGSLVRTKLVSQIKNLLLPGKEPNANGSLSGWTHGSVANTFLLAKNTPSVWSEFDKEQRDKIDFLMKAMAIAGHFGFDDDNDFRTGLGYEGNFYKKSNPNYIEGYMGVMIASSLYFGADSLNNYFLNFNAQKFKAQVESYNFKNIYARWKWDLVSPVLENGFTKITTTPLSSEDSLKNVRFYRGKGVKNTFTYYGVGLHDPFGLFKKVVEYSYGTTTATAWTKTSKVIDTLITDGKIRSYILGGASSPYKGEEGMCFEFHSTDGSANSPRSSLHYVFDGLNNSIATRATLKALGKWTGPAQDIEWVEKRMFVGVEDFIFKAERGFKGFSKRVDQEPLNHLNLMNDYPYRPYEYNKEIWVNFLKSLPEVNIIAPKTGSKHVEGQEIILSASASVGSGRIIRKVEFFAGSQKVGEATSSPYNFTWKNAKTGTYVITAKATDNAGEGSVSTSSPVTVIVEAKQAGKGLSAVYYDNIDFTGKTFTRTDSVINFNWGNMSPDVSMGADDFSVRWTGQVKAKYSETYTFYTYSDDGVRLWVNGVQLINNWTNHARTENKGTIQLVAGEKYDIKMEYYERGGGAVAILHWSSSSQPKAVIPAASLFPAVVDQAAEVQALQLFPNPASSYLEVVSLDEEPVTLVFNDTDGSFSKTYTLSGQTSYVLDLNSFKSGIYIVRINHRNNTILKRIIKD